MKDLSTHEHGRTLWRSLEELADSDEFHDLLVREFPSTAPQFLDPTTRRQFLRVMAASLALAGVTGCAYQPAEEIVPYVTQPPRITPGKPLHFATAVPLDGFGVGVLVESHEGRPSRIEGNPAHPASLGAADSFSQAAVLDLYDRDRSQVVLHRGRVSTWNDFHAFLTNEMTRLKATKGDGLRILTGTVTSPTVAALMRELQAAYPAARWHAHDPVGRRNTRLGAIQAFGREVEAISHLENADVIVSLDADFLAWGPARLRDARRFADRREPNDQRGMNRLYVAEPAPTITGAMADHRLAVRASEVASIARMLAQSLQGNEIAAETPHGSWVASLASDLKSHRGKSLVLVGESQPAEVHALAHAINALLDSSGKTVTYHDAVCASPINDESSLATLTSDIAAGKVSLLLMLGVNPGYDAPIDLDFKRSLKLMDSGGHTSIHLGPYADETAQLCAWHLPQAHFLESWNDIRAFDGSATIQQPLIKPLYEGQTTAQVIASLLGRLNESSLNLVRKYWQGVMKSGFDAAWRAAVHDGVVAGSNAKRVDVKPKALAELLEADQKHPEASALEICFRPDSTIWDGQFANSGWLQELPKPITKLTWDNALRISPADASRWQLRNEQVVELTFKASTLRTSVWIDPGHASGSMTLSLGYGRTQAGRVGSGQGFNAYALRTSTTLWHGDGVEIKPTQSHHPLATTQHFHNMAGRDLVRATTFEEFRANPQFADHHENPEHGGLSLYPGHPYDGHKWGMSINLNRCIGCNACVTACQTENNIPVVGKDEVAAGRAMHWIRVDRYYEGDDPNSPDAIYHQPVPCMHCENAPCELVCPVNATVHDSEGLNVMVYNRCVGTRYCGNNCPYKVRRFNYFGYTENQPDNLKLLHNPEVTVRTRGVMEKCTYCVQRIVEHRINVEKEDRPIRDGEFMTACQAACPTRAIVFGDLNDKTSAVSKAKQDPRDYGLLEELNTRPRTTYLAKLTNPKAEE